MSATASTRFGWRAGSVLRLVFADGTEASVRVVAVLPDADLPSPVLLRRETVRAHDPSALTTAAYVTGAELSTVDAALAATPGARAVTAAVYRGRRRGPAGLAVRAHRGRPVGRLHGHRGGQHGGDGDRRPPAGLRRPAADRGDPGARSCGRSSARPALGVALGATVGFAVALPALLGIRAALQEITGGPVALVLPWAHTAAVILACLVFALTAAVTAGRRAVPGDASDQVQWAM